MIVYVAWGYQGERILGIYEKRYLAVEALRRDWAAYGNDPDDVSGEEGDLDGMYVEPFEVILES